MEIKIHLSGYDILYGGEVIYFGIMRDASYEEKLKAAKKKKAEIEKAGVERYITPKPLPTLLETDEAILNINANIEYLVALSEI